VHIKQNLQLFFIWRLSFGQPLLAEGAVDHD